MKRLLLLLFLLPVLLHAQQKIDEHWHAVLVEGKTAGYVHTTSWQTGEGLVRSEVEQTLRIRRFGAPFCMTERDVWIEDTGSGLVSLRCELDGNGRHQVVEARRAAGGLAVRVIHGDAEERRFLSVDGEILGVHAAERKLEAMIGSWEQAAEPGGSEGQRGLLSYRLFSPETLDMETIQLRVLGRGKIEDSAGRKHEGILVEERSSGLPGVVTTQVYGKGARFLYSRTPVGLTLEILGLELDPSMQGARAPGEGVQDLFDVASLTVPVRGLEGLPAPMDRIEAVSVLFHGRGAAALHAALEATETVPQEGGPGTPILAYRPDEEGQSGQLLVRVARGSSGAAPPPDDLEPSPRQSLPQELERYLDGGFRLDLEDPRLGELLSRCDRRAGNAAAKVRCLERLVHEFIENKSLAYGFAGAGEILDARAGDCTEHAMLLVALLRKAGFASRLAYGLVLTESGFVGHAWAELLAGESWHWLDPSFPGGRPYGLKMSLGVLDPAEPVWTGLSLSLLRIVGAVQAEILEWELE
jgi:transglutaminase-like putative cysteine protease